jgi:hypothetical protein
MAFDFAIMDVSGNKNALFLLYGTVSFFKRKDKGL